MRIYTYAPSEILPEGVILPEQTHGNRIVEIITGQENLSDCDGIWTTNSVFKLGVRTADCAPLVFWEGEKFGVVHAGWRGLVNGIIEKMLDEFESPQIWAGPLLPKFEIQKDFCYAQIQAKFGEKFFKENQQIIEFDFQGALKSLLPLAQFDQRSTLEDLSLASWRRNRNESRNVTVVSR